MALSGINRDIHITGSEIMQPVEMQARLTKVIQTQNAVSIGATTGSSTSVWFPCDGFDTIAMSLLNDASTNSSMAIDWSFDGTTPHGNETILSSASNKIRATIVPIKAPYFRIYILNTDASAHTMSAWAYLKA